MHYANWPWDLPGLDLLEFYRNIEDRGLLLNQHRLALDSLFYRPEFSHPSFYAEFSAHRLFSRIDIHSSMFNLPYIPRTQLNGSPIFFFRDNIYLAWTRVMSIIYDHIRLIFVVEDWPVSEGEDED